MANRTVSALTLGLLATTAFVEPTLAQDTGAATGTVPQEPPSAATVPANVMDDERDVIVVTATKREENLQDVPVSVQVLGTRKLDYTYHLRAGTIDVNGNGCGSSQDVRFRADSAIIEQPVFFTEQACRAAADAADERARWYPPSNDDDLASDRELTLGGC